ncbi:cobalamin biosynthesis protein [Sphingobium chungbukense]|uniref:Precorrin methylase n=1 Tax=Sphingobium chungbukense TaxID=56193 RepID=A0A0M3ATU0_9SPHN|nr:cobalamin biosynthesis protein [Sphingobium chungbukense]KKW91969.1 precorrin methylase [Sphingobium chungbukense]
MIVAGFGFRANATLASFQSALEAATGGGTAIAALATLDRKSTQLAPFADHLSLPLITVAPDRMTRQTTLTRSRQSLDAHGTGSVAEAAALAAAGPGARLLAPRAISRDRLATCALAEGVPA